MAEASPAGSGGAPRPSPPPADGMLQIRGGVGGLSFQFEELLAGAAALDGVVRQLASVEAEAEAVRRALFSYQSDSYPSGSNAIVAVGEGGQALGRVRAELERLTREVRASHREYEFTEARNALLLRMGVYGPGALPGPGVLGVPPSFGLPPVRVRDVVEYGIAGAPAKLALLLGISAPLAGGMGATSGTGDARRIIRTLAAAPGLEFLKPRPVRIAARETAVVDADLSPAGLLLRAEAVGRTSGDIEVLQLGDGGHRAWVVVFPGTQLGGPSEGTNPFDPAGIAEGLGYDSEETSAAILQALHEAGAGAGEQLAAVGYSQGGIHAMNLSQDKAILSEYDLKFVLTAGSPVGGIEPAPGISTLHLEHEQDWVPGADGLPNADTRDRVTVTLTNPLDIPAWKDFGLGPGHRLGNYAAGAETIAASGDPSLQASAAALAAVVGAGGAATATRFSLRREAMPAHRGAIRAPGPRHPAGPPAQRRPDSQPQPQGPLA
ncbi:MAG: hypothetical protein JWO49_1135 [Arthrobacter sp.]|nr:hypothetical protein [Arthrobacter sp.]MCU1548072.1 hypothetical protein [Arthrobacter sp.]